MYSLFFFLLLATAIKPFPPKYLFTTPFFLFYNFLYFFTIFELSQCEMFSETAR